MFYKLTKRLSITVTLLFSLQVAHGQSVNLVKEYGDFTYSFKSIDADGHGTAFGDGMLQFMGNVEFIFQELANLYSEKIQFSFENSLLEDNYKLQINYADSFPEAEKKISLILNDISENFGCSLQRNDVLEDGFLLDVSAFAPNNNEDLKLGSEGAIKQISADSYKWEGYNVSAGDLEDFLSNHYQKYITAGQDAHLTKLSLALPKDISFSEMQVLLSSQYNISLENKEFNVSEFTLSKCK